MVDVQSLKLILDKKQEILSGNAAKVSARRAEGKGLARERIAKLLDEGSFVETDALLASGEDYAGVVSGSGTVEGRPVYLFAQDFTVHGGAMGVNQARKINKVLDLAMKTGAPVIAMCDSAGVRVDEGAGAMNAFASIYGRLARLSGVCPLICLVMGPVVGGAAMIAELADVTVQVKGQGALMVYGPTVVGSLTGKTLKSEDVGGADVMMAQGGVSLVAKDEDEAVALCVKTLSFLPSCNIDGTEIIDSDDLNRDLTVSEGTGMSALVADLADCGDTLELGAGFGTALKTVLCRIGGHTCGIVASENSVNDGMIDAAAARKAARFIRMCDCFDLPVVTLIDSKGIAVPDENHQADMIKAVSALLYAYAEATCAKVSVITGNAIGQSFIALSGKENADLIYAWPGTLISALTAEAAVQVLYTDELKKGASRFELETAFATDVAGALNAAKAGLVDDIIDPKDTRKYVINALEMLANKAQPTVDKKHGNQPV